MQTPSAAQPLAFSVMACGQLIAQQDLPATWQSARIQEALGAARQRFGHVLCLCRRHPLKLQIRRRKEHFHLAVWPNEGPAHDSECSFFRDELADAVASSDDPAGDRQPTGHVVPDSVGSAVDTPTRARVSFHLGAAGGQASGPSISIRSLGVQLWERASLCRWHPSWTRDWGRTRYQILLAAGGIELNGAPAEDLLFVPRPYRESQQNILNSQWEDFARGLTINKGSTRVLIAPVRRFTPESDRHPPVMHLRHLRAPIGLSRACHEFVVRDCRNALRSTRLQAIENGAFDGLYPAPEVIGFFLVEGSSRGGVWARAAWLMPVHPTSYIPAANPNTVRLVDRLIEQGYAFQHLISDTQASRRTTADWLVRHVIGPDDAPVARAALEILDRGSNPEYLAARSDIAVRMHNAGIPTWTWVPGGRRADREVPQLPPSDHVPGSVARDMIRQIQATPSADYRFGASRKFSFDERKTA